MLATEFPNCVYQILYCKGSSGRSRGFHSIDPGVLACTGNRLFTGLIMDKRASYERILSCMFPEVSVGEGGVECYSVTIFVCVCVVERKIYSFTSIFGHDTLAQLTTFCGVVPEFMLSARCLWTERRTYRTLFNSSTAIPATAWYRRTWLLCKLIDNLPCKRDLQTCALMKAQSMTQPTYNFRCIASTRGNKSGIIILMNDINHLYSCLHARLQACFKSQRRYTILDLSYYSYRQLYCNRCAHCSCKYLL